MVRSREAGQQFAPAGALPVSVVARRLGVPPATLRTWARRYGLQPSGHVSGAHRRYTPEDLQRLDAMRRLLVEGVRPADAARLALAGAPPLAALAPADGAEPAPPPDAAAAQRGLRRAATALDAPAVTALVRTRLRSAGVVATWNHLLCPVLDAVGRHWAATGEGVEVEHLLAAALARVLDEHAASATRRAGRPVLLAGAPGEQHALPLHALAAALAEQGRAARLLGPDLPGGALAAAVRRTGPAVVFVWAQRAATADGAALAALPAQRPAPSLVVGGPGWRADRAPAGATVVTGLAEAVGVISARAA